MSSFIKGQQNTLVSGPRGGEVYAVLICQGCNDRIIVIERVGTPHVDGTPGPQESLHWWPTPGAGTLDEAIPETVALAYDEGVRCLSVHAHNAGAAMLRSALAQIVQDLGDETARKKARLADALKQMTAAGTLPASLSDWAVHIKDLGNAGAHPELFGAVTRDEAEDLQRLVQQMTMVLYVVPASIQRSREGRSR